MKAKWVLRGLVGLLVVAAVAGVLAYALNIGDRPGHPFAVAYEPRLGRISAAMRQFDAASEFLVEGYRDKVPAADWVQNATDRIPVMARALDVVEAGIPNVKKGLDRADLRKFVRISNDELAAIEELRTALKENLSARKERDAWDHFEVASIRKGSLYQEVIMRTAEDHG
jgi:hypothetical protein